MRRTMTAVMALVLLVGCGRADANRDTVAQALAIADEYVAGYYDQFPEDAYETGYPAPLDRMGDHSPAATAAWEAREDAWVGRLLAIDAGALEGTEAAVPYTFSLERLQASVARRVCRTRLWNVSPTWTGWHNFFGGVFAKQPVARRKPGQTPYPGRATFPATSTPKSRICGWGSRKALRLHDRTWCW